ncbi:MAG: hypothetical protein JW993_01325 [Sedimentisphaerales bacterium]|nr:hypothetical protein [Sedimentisphaerales bacterium]
MKKIRLLKTQGFTTTIDRHNIPKDQVSEIDGKMIVKLPTIDIAAGNKELDVARDNGAEIVYATTSIEQKLEDVLLTYFFGPFVGPDPRRDFFVYNVLQSSGLQFSFKKGLVCKIAAECDLLEGKTRSTLEGHLKKIMDWRNAFAHGRLQHDAQRGSSLRYYMGSPQVLALTDEYWSTVEKCFEETHAILSEVRNKLGELYKQ